MNAINNNQSGVDAATQFRLHVTVNKEVDIYIAGHPTYAPYRDELKGEVFITILRRLPESKPDSYLKKAAQRTLYQYIRNITDTNRTSNIELLNNTALITNNDTAMEEQQEEVNDRYAAQNDEAISEMNPREHLEWKEVQESLERLLSESDSHTQRLIRDRLQGIPIRDSAAALKLSKSTAFDLICKFRQDFLKTLR